MLYPSASKIELALRAGTSKKKMVFHKSHISVGRRTDCDICLGDYVEIVSRNHAVFDERPDGWEIKDCDSAHGTFLNGERLEPHKGRLIRKGDVVCLGEGDMIAISITRISKQYKSRIVPTNISGWKEIFRQSGPAIVSILAVVMLLSLKANYQSVYLVDGCALILGLFFMYYGSSFLTRLLASRRSYGLVLISSITSFAVSYGVLCTPLASKIEALFTSYEKVVGQIGVMWGQSILEELVKSTGIAAVIVVSLSRRKWRSVFQGTKHGIEAGIYCGIAFALLETYVPVMFGESDRSSFYLKEASTVEPRALAILFTLPRAIHASIGHCCYGAVVGFFLGLGRRETIGKALTLFVIGVVLASVPHFCWNYIVSADEQSALYRLQPTLMVISTMISYVIVLILIRAAQRQEVTDDSWILTKLARLSSLLKRPI